MKKAIITLILLLCIICIFSFSTLYVFFNLKDPSNQINQTFRKPVMHYSTLRKLFRLEQVGDGRYEYMYKRALPLEIFLYYQEGVALEDKTLETISRTIQSVTHRYVPLTVHKPIIIPGIPEKIDDAKINEILDTYGTDSPLLSKTVPLHIFLLKYYTPHPSYAGLVVDAHAMMLFKEPITYVSEDESSPYPVEISTILHEFAHLTGADHIENPDCIMADTVENLNFYSKLPDIRTTYCEEDINAIVKALQ